MLILIKYSDETILVFFLSLIKEVTFHMCMAHTRMVNNYQ